MKPINIHALTSEGIDKLLAQQIVLSVFTQGSKIIWLKAYFFEDTEGVYRKRYEVVSKDTIILSTLSLDEALKTYRENTTEISAIAA